jgi:zinc transport system permease protein
VSVFELPPFMWLALAAGVLVGLTAPAVGFFLVERRMSLVGDGVGHIAFAGVAAAHLLGLPVVPTAVAASVGGALLVEALRSRGSVAGERGLAVLLYLGLALGAVLASAARTLNAGLFAFLFGSILTLDPSQLLGMASLAVIVLLTVGLLYRLFVAASLDEDAARVGGVPVLGLNLLLATLAALTVSLAMQAVGLLLVAALMVLPVLAASLLAWSVRSTILLAMGLGVASAVVGLLVAYRANLAPGGTIVLVAAGFFLLAVMAQALRRSP